jgi:hypothetical protein
MAGGTDRPRHSSRRCSSPTALAAMAQTCLRMCLLRACVRSKESCFTEMTADVVNVRICERQEAGNSRRSSAASFCGEAAPAGAWDREKGGSALTV